MCQLEYVDAIGSENGWLNDKVQFWIRKLRYYKRVLSRIRYTPQPCSIPLENHEDIQSGDLVRVRSRDEIKSALDKSRKTKGCTFQVGMYDCCGREYRVLKRVDYFFDEAKQKFCKCKNIFLLEGSNCTGTTAYLRPCDRNCYFFWHVAWLKKISPSLSPSPTKARVSQGEALALNASK